MVHKRIFLLCLLVMNFMVHSSPQDFIWTVGVHSFFDNREYFNQYVADQTIFGSRIYGYAGFAINQNNRFMLGTDYLYEYGSRGELVPPDVVVFYQGVFNRLTFKIGAFPRHHEIAIPRAIVSDTLFYYRPNIEGISIDYNTGSFRHNVWIDWTSRQSYAKREIFMLGFSGYLNKGILLYEHHFVMSHVAHSKNIDLEEHIRDNGGYNIMAGFNLSHPTVFDTLSFSTGLLGSWDRLRGTYDFAWPVGWISKVAINYKGIGFDGLFYKGDKQTIISGDGFYKAGTYGRTDFSYQRQGSGISGKLQFSLHFIPGIVDLSMSLVVRVQLDGNIELRLNGKGRDGL